MACSCKHTSAAAASARRYRYGFNWCSDDDEEPQPGHPVACRTHAQQSTTHTMPPCSLQCVLAAACLLPCLYVCLRTVSVAVQDVRGDIFAFGLCMLELLTLKQLDPQHCLEVPQLLTQVCDWQGQCGSAGAVGSAGAASAAAWLCRNFSRVCCWHGVGCTVSLAAAGVASGLDSNVRLAWSPTAAATYCRAITRVHRMGMYAILWLLTAAA